MLKRLKIIHFEYGKMLNGFLSIDKSEIDGYENEYDINNNNNNNEYILFDRAIRDNESILNNEDWDNIIKKQKKGLGHEIDYNKIEESLFFGINNEIREKVWKIISHSDNLALNHSKNLYQKLQNIPNKKIEHEISKDIDRTFSSEMLKINSDIFNVKDIPLLKKKLFNVLKAYANYDNKIGYAQGLNFIVLIIASTIKSESDSFWLLVELMISKNWREIYTSNTPKLIELLSQFITQLKEREPQIYEHFIKENVYINFYI